MVIMVRMQQMHIEFEHHSFASSSFEHYSFDVRFPNRVGLCPNGCPGRGVVVDFALAIAIAFLALALALAFVIANAFCRRLSLCLGNGARRSWSLHGWWLHG